MSVFAADISFNGVNFYADRINARKVPRTKKQHVGQVLVESRVLGYTTLQWRISIDATIYGPNMDTDRAALENSEDGVVHIYIDGHHDGNYIIPNGGLTFNDVGGDALRYQFSLELVEE